MIIIEYICNQYNFFFLLPTLSYLLIKKRKLIMYVFYGIYLDLLLMNKYLLNTLLLVIIYKLFPRLIKKRKIYFIICFILIIVFNTVINNNIKYLYSPNFILSFILNYIFYLSCNK